MGLAALVWTLAVPVRSEPMVPSDAPRVFALLQASLEISAPASTYLGHTVAGGQITTNLGPVTVTDGRVIALGWSATVSSTNFTTTGGATIATSNVRYWSGPATSTSGLAVFVPGQLTQGAAVTLASTRTAFSVLSVVLPASATWNPGIIVSPPPTATAGHYRGTITHSVS
jgi:hypothetical protein